MKRIVKLAVVSILAVSYLFALSSGSRSRHRDGSAPNRRIIQGVVSKIGRMPYLVRLYRDRVPFCGGSIISVKHVITAGHCFLNFKIPRDYLTVMYGIDDPLWVPKGNIIEVAEVKAFNNTEKMDLGILTMKTEFQFSYKAKAVTLRNYGGKTNEEALIGGWGLTENEGDIIVMRTRTVYVVDKDACRQQSKPEYQYQIDDTVTCTTPWGCWGDSGGPLVIRGLLVGVYARKLDTQNFGKCVINSPYKYSDFYTNVASYREFIDKYTEGLAKWSW